MTTSLNSNFWYDFGPRASSKMFQSSLPGTHKRKEVSPNIKHIGVILDTTRSLVSMDWLVKLSDMFGKMKFNLIQLRLVGDKGFTFRFPTQNRFAYSMLQKPGTAELYGRQTLQRLIRRAERLRIEVVPEITISTNSAGWYGSGYVVDCPNVLCKGGNIPLDLTRAQLMPLIFGVINELGKLFTSELLHLGHDDRIASRPCFEEAGINSTGVHDAFERKMRALFVYADIPESSLIRYVDTDLRDDGDSVGGIRHYLPNTKIDTIRTDKPFFVTADVLQGDAFDVYASTRQLVDLEPTGIVAELRHLYPSQWNKYQIAQRIMAFSLAIHGPGRPMTRDEFVAELKRTCLAHSFEDVDCSVFPERTESIIDITETQEWFDAHCELRTFMNEESIAKDIVRPFYNQTAQLSLLETSVTKIS